MRRRRWLIVLLGVVAVVAAVAALLVGCAKEEKLAIANLPPETYLAIADSIRNTTVYYQTLTWWGDDQDGEVAAFEYRWFIDPDEHGCRLDSNWVRTEERSKTFDLPVTHGESVHRFEVRAIDNEDLRDPTPCTLRLPVSNSPPQVMIWHMDDLPDTTFPSLLVALHGSDADGDSTIAAYVAWLDGSREEARTLTPPDTMVSLGREDFAGRFDRTRTLNVVAIDSGCDTSDAVAHTWYVKETTGRVLLIDDIGSAAGTVERPSDTFYRTGLDSCGEAYSALDLRRFGGPISAHNFAELFSLFDVVIWYNDPYTPASSYLTSAEANLMDYVEDGGRLMLSSLSALGSGGALRDSLWPEVFGIDSLFLKSGPTSNFDCKNWGLSSNTAVGLDSLKVVGLWVGAECMLPLSTATALYYIRPGTVNAQQTENYYVGLLNSWHTGKTALITFPLSRSNGRANAHREYCKIIDLLLN